MGNETDAPRSILVVDDSALVRRVACAVLGRNGFALREAASLDEAKRALSEGPIACVLCDVHLPGESGWVLVDWLTERAPALVRRVLFMSGDLLPEDRTLARDTTERPTDESPAALPCIAKPVTPEALVRRIRKLVAEADALDAMDAMDAEAGGPAPFAHAATPAPVDTSPFAGVARRSPDATSEAHASAAAAPTDLEAAGQALAALVHDLNGALWAVQLDVEALDAALGRLRATAASAPSSTESPTALSEAAGAAQRLNQATARAVASAARLRALAQRLAGVG